MLFNKGSVYHIKQMSNYNLPWEWRDLKFGLEVSIMFDIWPLRFYFVW